LTDIEIMRTLIAYTRERALEHKTFTGCFIVKDGEVWQKSMTSIAVDQNPLAHAELKALHAFIAQYGAADLQGCQLYTTQQPCPMCASAIVWCGIEKVVFGLRSDHQWETFDHVHRFFAAAGVACVGPMREDECRAIDELLTAHGI